MMEPVADLREPETPGDAAERFRSGPAPARADLEALSRTIATGAYRIDVERVAEAMLSSRDRPERRD